MLFRKIMINILRNFISHETVLVDGGDAPWLKKEIKKLIDENKNIFNCFRRSNNNKQLFNRLKDIQTQLNFLIGKPYSRITGKLYDIGKSSKIYFSILKSFLIGKKIHVFQRYLKTMNILQISRKKQNY